MKKVLFLIFTVILVLGAANIAMGGSETINMYYSQVTIEKDDTIWEIAQEFDSGKMTTKEYVKYIMDFNDIKSDKIMVGQKLIGPYFK